MIFLHVALVISMKTSGALWMVGSLRGNFYVLAAAQRATLA